MPQIRGEIKYFGISGTASISKSLLSQFQTGPAKDALNIKMASGPPTYGTTFKLEPFLLRAVLLD